MTQQKIKIDHPYRGLTGGEWLRGQLHAHTTASDGSRSMQAVINDYAKRGYHFLMISDHDIFTGAKQYKKVNNKGLLLIPGNEVSRNGPHLLHVNAEKKIDPYQERQRIISEINKGKGFAVINHPNWQDHFAHCPQSALENWIDYIGIEIYNGVIGRLSGSPYATDRWDMLLSAGRKIWGFANDDSHAATGDVEHGWNMVYTRKRNVTALCEAMRSGKFYASTGVTIDKIKVTGTKIRIESNDSQRIVALRDTAKRIGVVDDSVIEIDVAEHHTAKYIRFECWGSGEKNAWTQPFFIRA